MANRKRTSRAATRGRKRGAARRGATRRGAARSSGKASKELKHIERYKIHRIMKSIVGNDYRIAKTGSFGLSYLLEMVTQDLIRFAVQALERDRKRATTILPAHLLQGMQSHNDCRTGMHRVISNLSIKEQIASLNTKLNAKTSSRAGASPRGGRGRRARGSRSPSDGNPRRSPRKNSRSRSGSARNSPKRNRSPAMNEGPEEEPQEDDGNDEEPTPEDDEGGREDVQPRSRGGSRN